MVRKVKKEDVHASVLRIFFSFLAPAKIDVYSVIKFKIHCCVLFMNTIVALYNRYGHSLLGCKMAFFRLNQAYQTRFLSRKG